MKKQGIKRHIVLLVFAVLFMLCICGTVAAADNLSTTGGNSSLNKSASGNNSLVDPIIGVKVNYEYSSDSGINPGISVKDSKGAKIKFTKTYDPLYKGYKLSFNYTGAVSGTKFKVAVSAPGYKTQEQSIAVFLNPKDASDPNLYGSATFNMKATANYKLGRKVTAEANKRLNFKTADKVLCITTAGLTYLNGSTTEDCLEGILNGSGGKISYGQGNLLTLRKTRVDPVDFGFVVKKGSKLTIAYFKKGSLTPTYVGTISESMTSTQWKTVVKKFGNDAFPYASLANAWAAGLSTDTLRQAAFHGHVCIGTISGQAMIQTLLKYYPSTSDTGLPLEGVSYQVLGVPGNSDDDAFIYSMDDTSGKRAYVGVDTMVGTNMVGFIRWNKQTKTGTLIVMKFDEKAVVKKFKKETGLSAYSSISSELKFNKWMIKKLQSDPVSLVTIVKELEGLNEEQYHYLMGYEPNKGNTTVQAHGLDMNYINSLGLKKATRANVQYTTGNLTSAQIKQIGINAAKKAIELFKAMGITLSKDDPNLTVLTSAGYVRLNGQTTDMTMDGIYQILGSRLSRATLLPVHSALWKPLVFEFAYKNGTEIITKTMHYDPTTNQLVVDKKQNYNIEDALLYDPPYDALMAWLFHNHVCGGSSPGYLISDYILDNYPLGENEKYIYVTTLDNCKDDILQYLLGVSAGSGTYYNQRLTTEATKSANGEGGMNGKVGYIIRWNEKLQIGEVAIINWESPEFADGSISLEEFIKMYKNDYSSGKLVKAPIISTVTKKWITLSNLKKILGSGNPLADIMGLPNRKKSDLLPANGDSQNGNQNGTSTVHAPQGVEGTSGSGTSSSSSVGDSGPAVSAAAQTGVTSQAGETPGAQQGNAYEVSKVDPKSEDSGMNSALIVVGVILCGGLLGIGFFKGSILGFLRK